MSIGFTTNLISFLFKIFNKKVTRFSLQCLKISDTIFILIISIHDSNI
jgi:hypothetical protein